MRPLNLTLISACLLILWAGPALAEEGSFVFSKQPIDPADPEVEVRRFDCMDCHNRPAHQFRAPGDLLYDVTVLKSVLTGMLMYFIFYHSARDPSAATSPRPCAVNTAERACITRSSVSCSYCM